MARKVFFSFHHQGDSRRIGIVRNHGMCKEGIEEAGYLDAAEWQKLEVQGRKAIEDWIHDQLRGTSVTVVLIGAHTSEREWIAYEIQESYERGNALVGIYIHNLKGLDEKITLKGRNPFDNFLFEESKKSLATIVSTYDWVGDNGYDNFSNWIETAFTSWKKPEEFLILTKQFDSVKTNSISAIAAFPTNNSNTMKPFTPNKPWCE